MDKSDIIKYIRQFNKKYANIGFRITGLFGSFARGEEDIFSDVDLTYSIDHDRFYKDDAFAKLEKIEEIRREISSTLHRKIDLIPSNTSNELIRQSLERERIAI